VLHPKVKTEGFIFLPRRFRLIAAAVTIAMQLLIIATSNHNFINLLTILLCLFLLAYPATSYTVDTISGPVTFTLKHNVYSFTFLMFLLGIAWAFGKASVFKYISDDYPTNIGTISGVVGLAGGLGGFLLPIMFGVLLDLTGVRSTAFMLMYCVVWVSLIWMYRTEVSTRDVVRGEPNPAT